MSMYAISDLHGKYDIWGKIKKRIYPDDILFSLGDNIDRGPDGYKICLELMQMKNVYCICGNHEMMAIDAIPDLLKGKFKSRPIDRWFINGGAATWNQIEYMCNGMRQSIIKDKCAELINFFQNMKDEYKIIDKGCIILLSHAGFTVDRQEEADIGWDRQHFYDDWPQDKKYQNTYIIHGHTPVQYLNRWLNNIATIDFDMTPTIITYAQGHKIDIDLGTIASNRAALFNLNTFEVEYIE